MIYKDGKLRIRPWTEDDMCKNEYHNWFHDPEVTKYTSHCRFPIVEKDKQYVLDSINNGNLWWAIEYGVEYRYDDNGIPLAFSEPWTEYKLIGNIVLIDIDFINRQAELALIIGDKEYWAKGVGKKVCNLVLDHGFNKLGLNRIYLATPGIHTGMRFLARKIGMKPEGKKRDGIYLEGCFQDVICYSILHKEWKKEIIDNE